MRRLLPILLCLGLALTLAPRTPRTLAQPGCAAPAQADAPHAAAAPAPSGELSLRMVAAAGGGLTAVAANDSGPVFNLGPLIRSPARSWLLADLTRDIALANGLIYAASGAAGLYLLSPSAAAPLAALPLPGLATGVQVSAGRAYVSAAGAGGGLHLVDVANPAAPRLLSSAPVYGSASGLDLEGGLAYVVGGLGGGLEIFDVTNPLSPTLRGALITPGNAQGVAVSAGRAYIAAGACGLQVLDVRNPAAPALLGAVAVSGEALAVAVDATRAVVATSRGYSLLTLGAGLPQPRLSYQGAAPLALVDVAIWEDWAVLAGGGDEVTIFFEPEIRTVIAGVGVAGLTDLALARGVAYAGLSDGSLAEFFLTSPNPPSRGEVRRLAEQVRDLAASEEALYIAAGDAGLQTIGLDMMSGRSRLPLPGSSQAIALDPAGGRAFVAAGATGVHRLDLTNPLSPTLLASVDTPGAALGLALAPGGPLYVADRDSLRILDPDDGATIGAWQAPAGSFVQSVAVAGGRAYLADRSGLIVLDVRDPAAPRRVGGLGGFSGYEAQVAGGRLYIAAGPDGLLAFALDRPDAPRLAGAFDSPGSAQDLALAGDTIYLADDAGGLLVLRQQALTNRLGLPLITR